MKTGSSEPTEATSPPFPGIARQTVTRLLLIPFLLYLVWFLELFLFAGTTRLFREPEPARLLLYTVVTCIAAGIVLPVILMRRAFLSGAVNMFQFGFRSFRRTILVVGLTVLLVCCAVSLNNPFGADRSAFAAAFLLFLPTGLASVMVCWVIAGTHLQALVRAGGAPVSISLGVVITALFYTMTSRVLFPGNGPSLLFASLCAGLLLAVFFFAVRDVWAAGILSAACLVFITAGLPEIAILRQQMAAVTISAVITLLTLLICHLYLSRHYVTVPVPPA